MSVFFANTGLPKTWQAFPRSASTPPRRRMRERDKRSRTNARAQALTEQHDATSTRAQALAHQRSRKRSRTSARAHWLQRAALPTTWQALARSAWNAFNCQASRRTPADSALNAPRCQETRQASARSASRALPCSLGLSRCGGRRGFHFLIAVSIRTCDSYRDFMRCSWQDACIF